MSTGINIGKSIKVLEEGVSITNNVSQLDFTGAGVTASTVGDNVTVNVPGSIGATAFYMNESIAQAPYKEFSSAPTSAAEQIVPATIAGGVTVTVAAYQTPSGIPNTTVIPAGLWQFFLHFNAGAAGQNWIIRPKVYKRDLGGIETLIFTPDPEIVTNMSTTTTMYTCDGVFPNTTLLTTDRIVVKIDLENTTGVSQTANFRTEGSQHYSVATTTLNQVVPGGTVTNVTGTAPIASSGGTTPAISISQATTSTNGYLSSTDWNTFNSRVPSTRNLTINGTTQDLSADRTYTVTDANLSTSDITTNDVSITKHGFVPKAPNDLAKYLRGDGTWATIPSVSLGRILFVATTGNDGTAIIGSLSNPYLTLEAAQAASTNGDLIYVYPGTYTVTTTAAEGLAKDGLKYYFSPGTTVNKATTGPIFYANGFIYGFNVYGYGNFNKTTNTGAIFASNNILVYGSVTTFGSLVGGTGYTTGLKATTGGTGTGLIVNVTTVSSGVITALTISNPGSTYKVGDVITISGGATPATITITAIATEPNTDADISFEANDLYSSASDIILNIRSTARFSSKFNNLLCTSSAIYIDTSNVYITMNSIVANGLAFYGASGSLSGINGSNLFVTGYFISGSQPSSAFGANAIAISISSAIFNVHRIIINTVSGTTQVCNAIGCNGAAITLNVGSISGIGGQGASTIYLNGFCGQINGSLFLYGGQVTFINGITSGIVDTTYYGVKSNGGFATITVSGGQVTLKMSDQDFTTGFAISGGIVTLNGNWTNDDMGTASDLTGGTLIINGDYEYGGAYYSASRFYGINIAGGTLFVNGTIRINCPSTTAAYGLEASPIQLSYGKAILNGGTLISNVLQATPIKVINQSNCVITLSGGVNGSGYSTGNKATTTSGSGTGLIVNVVNANGVTGTTILAIARGTGYAVGDTITILGGTVNATFTVASISSPELKIYSGGMNTNLVQNGGTLAAKKMKVRYTVNAVSATGITLTNNLLSGSLTFNESNTTTYNTTALLAQRMASLINASATLLVTATQDTPGTDSYFYLEANSTYTGFSVTNSTNLTELGLVPGTYGITPKVLGTIIEDTDVE